jgi:PAS domain S-box-containing protein
MSVIDIDPSMNAAAFARVVKELQHRESLPWEGVHIRKDGSALPLEGALRYVRSERDYIIALVHDSREQRKPDGSQQNRFRAFVEQAPIAVIVSRNGIGIYANQAFAQMFGTLSVVGRPIVEIIAPEFRDEVVDRTRRRSLGVPVPSELESMGLRSDGTTFAIRVAVSSVDLQGETANIAFITDVSERKRNEEALIASESMLRAILESSTDAIGLHANGFWEMCNPAALRLFGYKSEKDVIGTSIFNVIAPVDRERVAGYFRNRSRERESPLVYQGLRSDGREIDLEVAVSPFKLNGSLHILVIARDITERKLAEESLLESEERFRKLFQDHSAAKLVIDPNTGAILDANQAAADFYGWSIKQLKSMNMQEINVLPPNVVREEMQKAALSEKIRFEFCHRLSDGSTRDVEVFSSGIELAGKRVLYSIIHDVTERKRTEELLRQGEERYRLMFESAPLAINITRGTDIIYANPSYLRLFGFSSLDELKAYPTLGMFAPESRAQMEENIRRRSQGFNVPNSYEVTYVRKDGTRIPILLHLASAVFADGPATVAFLMDLSESKRAEGERAKLEAQLQQAQKMESFGKLAGGVAHDFNNMLGVILGRAELALEQVNPSQPLRADLEEIQNAARRSAELTRKLLTFARKQTVSPKVIDLNEAVRGALKMLKRMIGENIALDLQAASDLWPIRVDPSQIDQILANLCVNARDAITDVGKVSIETANVNLDEMFCAARPGFKPGEYVLLTVADNGCGISKEALSHLFEPFFTTKDLGAGTGLGLATVYGAIKQNSGFIAVDSELGQGTAFSIYFPRHVGEVPHGQDQELASPYLPGHETILVVEDEQAILRLSVAMLEKLGYRILAASSPNEAISLAKENAGKIDLLITDVVMPEMNGRDLSKELSSFNPRLKCMFVSGYTADVISHQGMLDEGVHFLQKPFSANDLAARVRETLKGRGLRRSGDSHA